MMIHKSLQQLEIIHYDLYKMEILLDFFLFKSNTIQYNTIQYNYNYKNNL